MQKRNFHMVKLLMLAAIFTFSFLLFPSSADAGATRVQMKHVYPGAAATFDSPVTEGNLIVVFASGATSSASAPTVSDTLGNTYIKIATTTAASAGASRITAWYAYNVIGGTNTVTTTNVANSDVGITIIEYSGIRTDVDPLDVSATSSDSSADPIVAPLTTTAKTLIVYGWNNEHVNRYVGPNTGFTQVNYDSSHFDATGEKFDAPIGAYSPGIDVSSADNRSVIIAAAFKVARRALQKPPNNLGLLLHWGFEDATGTQVTDFSGNGYTGRLFDSNTTWINGKRGKALNFNGSEAYVSSTWNQLTGNATRTMSVWFKSTSSANANWVSWGANSSNQLSQLGTYVNEIGYLGFANELTTPNTSYIDGNWHHMAVTFDGASMVLYVDGVQKNAASTTLNTGTSDISVGRAITGGAPFAGALDEVRIYNRALTAAQVAALYGTGIKRINATAAGRGPTTGLVGHWTFDGQHLNLTTSTDVSGQGNHGTLTGSSAPTLGKLGQALSFDGTGDYVALSNSAMDFTSSSLSIAAWFKTTEQTTNHYIYEKSGTGSSPTIALYQQQTNGTGFKFAIANNVGGLGVTDTSGTTINDGAWHHVVATYDDGTTATVIYVDGVSRGTGFGSGGDIDTSIVRHSIGEGLDHSSGYGWIGSLDDVRIYNRVLTATEVKQLYNMSR